MMSCQGHRDEVHTLKQWAPARGFTYHFVVLYWWIDVPLFIRDHTSFVCVQRCY